MPFIIVFMLLKLIFASKIDVFSIKIHCISSSATNVFERLGTFLGRHFDVLGVFQRCFLGFLGAIMWLFKALFGLNKAVQVSDWGATGAL